MASPDTGPPPDRTETWVASVLAAGQWAAVCAVVGGFVVGWTFPNLLPGVGARLLWGGTIILAATPLVALLVVGIGGARDRSRHSWFAFGALAVVVLGAVLAR